VGGGGAGKRTVGGGVDAIRLVGFLQLGAFVRKGGGGAENFRQGIVAAPLGGGGMEGLSQPRATAGVPGGGERGTESRENILNLSPRGTCS